MQVASVAFEHQRFADTYATHLTCEILRFNLPPKAHVTYVTHLTCEILRLINKHDLKDYLLTPRTNVRIASAKHQNAFKFAALTLRTNVRVASKPADSAVSHIADLRSARTCGLLLSAANSSNFASSLTLRTNVRVASLAMLQLRREYKLTLRTNVRVASAKLHNCV